MADTTNHVIRMVNLTSGMVSTIAGTPGTGGWNIDGPASLTLLDTPCALAFAPPRGSVMPFDLLWTEMGSLVIRRFDWFYVSTVAGTPYTAGSTDGVAQVSTFGYNGPQGITLLGDQVLVADTGNHIIRKYDLGSQILSLYAGIAGSAGFKDGTVATALFNSPSAVVLDASGGEAFVADGGNGVIRRLSGGYVTTVAGIPSTKGHLDGASGSAEFDVPQVSGCWMTNVNIYLQSAKPQNKLRRLLTLTCSFHLQPMNRCWL